MFVCHLREVCKKLTATATAVVNSLFYLVLEKVSLVNVGHPQLPYVWTMEWNGEW